MKENAVPPDGDSPGLRADLFRTGRVTGTVRRLHFPADHQLGQTCGSAIQRCVSLRRRNLEAGTGLEPVFTDLQSDSLYNTINKLN